MIPYLAFKGVTLEDVAQLDVDIRAWQADTTSTKPIAEMKQRAEDLIQRCLDLISERDTVTRKLPDTESREELAEFFGHITRPDGAGVTGIFVSTALDILYEAQRTEDWTEQERFADFRKAYSEARRSTAAARSHAKVSRRDAFWIWRTIQWAMERQQLDGEQYTVGGFTSVVFPPEQSHTVTFGDPPTEMHCFCDLDYDHHGGGDAEPVIVDHAGVPLGIRTKVSKGHLASEVTPQTTVQVDLLCPKCRAVLSSSNEAPDEPEPQVSPVSHGYNFREIRSRGDGKGYLECDCGWEPDSSFDIPITETDAEVKYNQHLDEAEGKR